VSVEDKILVTCWHCGKKFKIEKANVYAGQLFCSDKCRIDNLKRDIECEKEEILGWRKYEKTTKL